MRPKRRSRWSAVGAVDGPVAPGRPARRPRGRPSKFGRPGHVVALTLPEDVIRALRQIDPDVGWAIVRLAERRGRASVRRSSSPDVALVSVAARRSLIVVNRAVFRALPGVNIIPLTETRAFLALDAGRGMSDLELAVIDRLSDRMVTARERQALGELRAHLAAWRRDRRLRFHTEAIIVLERVGRGGPRPAAGPIDRRTARARKASG